MPEVSASSTSGTAFPSNIPACSITAKWCCKRRSWSESPSTPTPTFSANYAVALANPEWGVPDGIKVNEIAPRLSNSGGGGGGFLFFGGGGSSEILQRLGPATPDQNGHPVHPDFIDWSSVDIRRYQFTQGAGKDCVGRCEIPLPKQARRLHARHTPDRHLFGDGLRAFSHGCMRQPQNPLRSGRGAACPR